MGPIEQEEFDPTRYRPEYVVAGVGEGIQSILDRVAEAWTRSPNVVLIIPQGALAFNATHDFLALGKLQGGRDVRVSVASLDPTIAGLARVLGFHTAELPEGYSFEAGDAPHGRGTGGRADADIEQPTSPLPLGRGGAVPEWVLTSATPAYPSPAPGLTTSTWLGDPEMYQAASAASAASAGGHLHARSPTRPGMPAPRTRPRQTGGLASAVINGTQVQMAAGAEAGDSTPARPPFVSTTPSGRIKARRMAVGAERAFNAPGMRVAEAPSTGVARPGLRVNFKIRWGRVLAVLAVVLVLALGGGAAYAYVYLPQATVEVRPLDQTIGPLEVQVPVLAADVGTGTGASAEAADPSKTVSAPSVSATLITTQVTEEGTRPASGNKQVPQGRAQGTMRFTNRTGGPVAVPAGLQFKAPNGVVVQTTQGGTVPPTVFGVSFGTLDLPIAATVEGPDGNIGAGQISGVYNGVLNYSNSAMQGGTLKTVKVVTPEDIDGLKAELRSRAEGKLSGMILDMVADDQQIITPTITMVEVKFEPDHQPGQDGDAVQARLTVEARAYVFRKSEMRDAVAQAMYDWVQANVPAGAGPRLDPAGIQFTSPRIRSIEQGRVVYTTSASARVQYSLTPELADQIRALVRGKSIGEARDAIISAYGRYVAPVSIQASVLWFGIDWLPGDAARIAVVAAGGR
jgi:hypothetical protein